MNNERDLELAGESDAGALRSLYGQCAAWLRAGEPIPDDLRPWLAEKLEALAQAIHKTRGAGEDARNKEIGRALQVRRAGRGRPKSPKLEVLSRGVAEQVLGFMVRNNVHPEAAAGMVADWMDKQRADAAKGGPSKARAYAWLGSAGALDKKAVYDAWLKHGKDVMAKAGVVKVKRPKSD